MTDDEADSQIDAQLRNVTVPAGLAARLREIAFGSDREIDRELAAVPVPSTLAARLRDIVTDAPLEQDLNDVPIPEGLQVRLRSVAERTRPVRVRQEAGMQAIAASLLLAIGIGYSGFAWQLLTRAQAAPQPITTYVVMQPSPLQLRAESGEFELVMSSAPASAANDLEQPPLPDAIEPWLADENPSPAESPVNIVFTAARGQQLAAALNHLRSPVVGAAPIRLEDMPQLDLVRLPMARGIATPLLPRYDRAFLLRTGFHPPVLPAVHQAMRQSLAPLSLATDSFDEALAAMRRGKRLPAELVRPEDFIAAIEHDLPEPSPGDVSLTVTATPSRFGPKDARLLGLGVRAGESLRRERKATHLVVAVDFSAGLARSGSWPWVQEAIVETIGRLGDDDRLSLVFFQDHVVMGSTPLDRESAGLVRRRLRDTAPQGDVNPAVGLEAALDLALTTETSAEVRQVVVLTDGHFDLPAAHQQRLKFTGSQSREAGIPIDVCNLSGSRSVAAGPEVMSRLLQSQHHSIDSRRKLVHHLLGLLHGNEAIMASDVKMVVRFAPQAVAAYRLVGHEANAMAQLSPPAAATELRCGDEALVLFELLPLASYEQETVAEVELSWIEPSTSQTRTLRRQLGRSELMQPWESASPHFRAAAIAAEAAEQLRGSRAALREFQWHSRDPVDLAELASQARAVSSQEPESLRQLIALIEAAVQE